MRKLKTTGLALVAAFVISAVGASVASAEHQFHSNAPSGETRIEGLQSTINVFGTEAGEVECQEAEFAGGQLGGTAWWMSVEPVYAECIAFGLWAEVDTSTCSYDLAANWFPVSIDCGFMDVITVTVMPGFHGPGEPFCEITIGDQETEGEITYKNHAGPPKHITVSADATDIDYTVYGGEGFCGLEGTHTDGTYTGDFTLKGFDWNSQIQVDLRYE